MSPEAFNAAVGYAAPVAYNVCCLSAVWQHGATQGY